MVSDRFRQKYRELSEDEQAQIENIKSLATAIDDELSVVPDSREKSLALTKLEEAVMWAVKGITA